MQDNCIWLLVACCFLFVILFCNKKVCIWLISFIFVYKLNLYVNYNLAELLTTVFSIIFTVLFGFASVMIGKIDSNKKIEKQVAEETFVSIVSSTILSLFAAIISILIIQVKDEMMLQILSFTLYSFSLIIVLFLLLITKRTFLLYIEAKE